MKEFEVTIKATAYKKTKLFAETEDMAIKLANDIYCKTDLLDIEDKDVKEISLEAEEIKLDSSPEYLRSIAEQFFSNKNDVDDFIFRQS